MTSEIRSLLAIVLSVTVLVGWSFFFGAKKEQDPVVSPKAIEKVETATVTEKLSAGFPAEQRASGVKVGLENDLISLEVDTNGGVLSLWRLKNYTSNGKTEAKKESVYLTDATGSDIGDFNVRNANFNIPSPIPFNVAKKGPDTLELVWRSAELTIYKRFYLNQGSYRLEMETEFENNGNITLQFLPVVSWSREPAEESPQVGALFFKSPPDKWLPVYFKENGLESLMEKSVPQSLQVLGNIGWIGSQSRYFLGGLRPLGSQGQSLELGKLGKTNFMRMLLPPAQVLPKEKWVQKFHLYGGPKEFERLKETGPGFDKTIGYGIFSFIAIPILYLLQFFYTLFNNYGLSIIALTILIKLLLNPINRKSMKSMKKMSAVQHRLKELREKHGADKQKLNAEMMQLFKTHKINPMGGCLPMLLQFPIYIALYKVLWGSVELYHSPFFAFYKDLSAPDPYFILPILVGVSFFFQTKLTPNPSVDPAQQKIMMLMPLMFSVVMFFLPAGLCLYILVNTGMTIIQQTMYQRDLRFRDLIRGRLS